MSPSGKVKYNGGCFRREGSAVWEFYYIGDRGTRTSMAGYSSLEETRKLRQQKRDQHRAKQLGVFDPEAEAFKAGQSTPIDKLVADFETVRDTPKNTEKHNTKVMNNLRAFIAGAKIKRAHGITKDAVETAVEAIRKDRQWSFESCNQMITAVRTFTNWLSHNGVIRGNPLADITKYNVNVDRRHDRRELSDDEITKLFGAAMASRRDNASGPVERYLLCRTALETGFRKEEFRPLDKARFDLTGDMPGIYLEAWEEKGKRGAKQPVSKTLAGLLAEYFSKIPDRKNILRVPHKAGPMMRRLCIRAKVPHVRGGKYADFHAWRHTFISRLANSTNPPISLWTVKMLARHKSIKTTEKYVHRRVEDERVAVNALGTACAALALAPDGLVRVKLAQFGTVTKASRRGGVKMGLANRIAGLGGISPIPSNCTGRESNPQPSASEAKAQSNAKGSKRKSYVKAKTPALQGRMHKKRKRAK